MGESTVVDLLDRLCQENAALRERKEFLEDEVARLRKDLDGRCDGCELLNAERGCMPCKSRDAAHDVQLCACEYCGATLGQYKLTGGEVSLLLDTSGKWACRACHDSQRVVTTSTGHDCNGCAK